MGPGAMQLTKILLSTTSLLSALVKPITPALAAEYAAKYDSPSLPANRSHVDDAATTPAPHLWQYSVRDLQHADQIDFNDLLPVARLVLIERMQLAQIASVVNKNVDARTPADDFRQCVADLIRLGHV
jgi:hypothetical protein